jgi:hypothetical protein
MVKTKKSAKERRSKYRESNEGRNSKESVSSKKRKVNRKGSPITKINSGTHDVIRKRRKGRSKQNTNKFAEGKH